MNTNRIKYLFDKDSNEEIALWSILAAIDTKALVDKRERSISYPATSYTVELTRVWNWAVSRPRRNGFICLPEFLEAIEKLDNLSIINADFPYYEISLDDNLYYLIARSWASARGAKKFNVATDGSILSPLNPYGEEIWAKTEADARTICMNRFHRIKRLHDAEQQPA